MSTFKQLREEHEAAAVEAKLSEPAGTTNDAPADPEDAPDEGAEGEEGEDRTEEDDAKADPAGDEEPDEEGEEGEPADPDAEPDETPTEDDEEAPEPDEEPESEGELSDLREQVRQLAEQNQQLVSYLKQQEQAKQEPKGPAKPDPVDEVLEVLYDQRLTKDQREQALARYTPATQAEAAARVRQGEEELRLLATKPEGWTEKRIKPLVQPIEERLARLEQGLQLRAWNEFTASVQDLTKDPKSRDRLAREIAAGKNWHQAADEIRKDRELGSAKRREEQVERKDARHKARQEARRAQGGRKADQKAGAKGSPFTGKEKTFAELRQKAERARKEDGDQ